MKMKFVYFSGKTEAEGYVVIEAENKEKILAAANEIFISDFISIVNWYEIE